MTRRGPPPPPWLPDWKVARHYPARLTIAEWRWQFLRRRRDYQADFASCAPAGGPWEFLVRGRVERAELREATPALMAKYGVERLLDPAAAHAPPDYFPPAPAWNVHAGGSATWNWQQMGYVLCRVDLAAPLDAQLEVLRRQLRVMAAARGLAPESRRQQREWPLYLRVLDAYAAGARPAAIVDWLHPDGAAATQASRWRAAARKQQMALTGRQPMTR